jgi:hypothetical protein
MESYGKYNFINLKDGKFRLLGEYDSKDDAIKAGRALSKEVRKPMLIQGGI